MAETRTFHQPIQFDEQTTHGGAATFSSGVTFSGTATYSSGAISTFSNVPTLSAGFVDRAENLTTAGTMSAYGLSTVTIASSSNGTTAYTLPAPIAGVRKSIASITLSTGGVSTVTPVSGSLGSSFAAATFSSQGTLELFGASTSRWAVVGITTGTVTLA